ncbi:MAG: dihydrolipoyl dehydrogenase [Candidatus Magasanikbacteria bacterium]
MKSYDIIVIGGGGGAKIISPAADLGLDVAAIEQEKMGGTCLNRGCIPSKMLIYPADIASKIDKSDKYGLTLDQDYDVNWEELVSRVNDTVDEEAASIPPAYEEHSHIDYYNHHCKFVDNKVVEVDGERITAEKIFIATGARPFIAPIEGLEDTPYMTSREALRNTDQPDDMVIIGGGYIATELGHFYGQMGTELHVLVRNHMISNEDKDIREEFTKAFASKHNVYLDTQATKVDYDDDKEKFLVQAEDKIGSKKEFVVDELLVATGIQPNTTTLGLENTNIETDDGGFIKADDYLETTQDNVWVLGDVVGNYFFRHTVNYEGEYLMESAVKEETDEKLEYPPVPHAIFSDPQIGGVGVTEDELKDKGKEKGEDYIVGMNKYESSAKGMAMMPEYGLAKAIFDTESRELIGAHVVGEQAANMIHTANAFMYNENTLDEILDYIYIHPAINEIFRNAVRDARSKFEQSEK